MRQSDPVIFIVDDDPSVCRALGRLLRSVGMESEVFGTSDELLSDSRRHEAACYLLDVRLPGTSGFELKERLAAEGSTAPVIFITAHRGGAVEEEAERAGAVTLLYKPFDDQLLLGAIHSALEENASEGSEETKGQTAH